MEGIVRKLVDDETAKTTNATNKINIHYVYGKMNILNDNSLVRPKHMNLFNICEFVCYSN